MSHDADTHDSHGAHGHPTAEATVDDGSASGPIGWPFALLVGIATLALSLWALLAHPT